MICPQCKEEGKVSTVQEFGTRTTLMGYITRYDKNVWRGGKKGRKRRIKSLFIYKTLHMKKSKLYQIVKETVEQYKGGLYQVKVGDQLWVGMSGMSGKDRSKVTKILPDGKVVDSIGNTYNPDGRLYKSSNPRYSKKLTQVK